MLITDANLARLLLHRTATGGARTPAAAKAVSSSSAAAASPASSRAPAAAGAGTSRNDDAQSVATSNLDLSSTATKMRKVLGKTGYAAVLAEVKKSAAAGSSSLSGGALRDTMAKHGVPLTGKEVRALSIKYHGDGADAVDVAAMLKDTFISTPASPAKAVASPRAAPSPAARKLGGK